MSVGHVAGPVAAQALDALVGQFADRTSFVRELVQNSLDAGAGRVDVDFHPQNDGLTVEVTDDGEGMDLPTIESCLLTLFRSSKERDLTKIGKFGVGFVSLFALEPTEVVVDTARDGAHYRVVFAQDRSYTLLEMDTPFEGTRVRIETPHTGKEGRDLVEATRRALHYWCRFARADIFSSCSAAHWGWEATEVSGAFTVDAPITLKVDEPGFRAVLGPSGTEHSQVAFHNRGLTLLERSEALIPGVTFRVEAAVLEHTLTRDNVLRDGHFHAIIERLANLAHDRLLPLWQQALHTACATSDHPQRRALLAVAHPAAFPIPEHLRCFPTPHGTLISIEDIRPRGVLAWTRRKLEGRPHVYTADAESPLTHAAEAAGVHVVQTPSPESAPENLVLAELADVDLRPLESRYRVVVPAEPPPLVDAASNLVAEHCNSPQGLQAAHFYPTDGPLAVQQTTPGTLRDGTWSDPQGPLFVHLGHPLLQTLRGLPVAIAAPLLARAVTGSLTSAPLPEPLAAAALHAATEVSP